MIGAGVVAAGWVCLLVALVVFGAWPLVPAGVVMMAVGTFVDLDRVKEPTRGKRP